MLAAKSNDLNSIFSLSDPSHDERRQPTPEICRLTYTRTHGHTSLCMCIRSEVSKHLSHKLLHFSQGGGPLLEASDAVVRAGGAAGL